MFFCRQGFIYLVQKTVTNKEKHFEEYDSFIRKAQTEEKYSNIVSIKIKEARKRESTGSSMLLSLLVQKPTVFKGEYETVQACRDSYPKHTLPVPSYGWLGKFPSQRQYFWIFLSAFASPAQDLKIVQTINQPALSSQT